MEEKSKILIADDNQEFCKILKNLLEKYEDIEIVGVANTDEEEKRIIEELRPEIVITDLVRNYKYTGLEIIKEYSNKSEHPSFLVISADKKEDIMDKNLKIDGYIKKPFFNYDIIIDEIRRIKKDINNNEKLVVVKQKSRFNLLEKILKFLCIKK